MPFLFSMHQLVLQQHLASLGVALQDVSPLVAGGRPCLFLFSLFFSLPPLSILLRSCLGDSSKIHRACKKQGVWPAQRACSCVIRDGKRGACFDNSKSHLQQCCKHCQAGQILIAFLSFIEGETGTTQCDKNTIGIYQYQHHAHWGAISSSLDAGTS